MPHVADLPMGLRDHYKLPSFFLVSGLAAPKECNGGVSNDCTRCVSHVHVWERRVAQVTATDASSHAHRRQHIHRSRKGGPNHCALNSSVPKLTGAEVAADAFLPDSGAAIAYSIGHCICNTLKTHSFTSWRRPSHMQYAKDTLPRAPEASCERSLRLRAFAVQPTQFTTTNGVYDYERSL